MTSSSSSSSSLSLSSISISIPSLSPPSLFLSRFINLNPFFSPSPKFSLHAAPPKPFSTRRHSLHKTLWIQGHISRDEDENSNVHQKNTQMFGYGSNDETGTQIPTQAQSIVEGSGSVMVSEFKPVPDVDYLQELLAIQQQGPRAIGFFGTRNMGFLHQELIEILSYAMVITKNHIYTSGASGTNAAVIRGALRAEKPELLTVILPQSLKKQPPESQELLSKVKNVIEKPHNDHLPLIEASRLCNMDIISHVQQVICFAFHDSRLLMETCQEAKNLRKIVTLFYLD
ncbi:uncharacterized protein LOC111024157 isoform X1 [Momordica charantia]|uniref:Uncharacterized protein LOC111024157 isoform X1 n=2 Tax=Momordica charantia TaxID=3673 RepID=A0A6J1DWJ8_MOMCH|nr:uncharacterized protein LOC111024157 isoform X1 [Momordica charantia]